MSNQEPLTHLPKLFTTLRTRYLDRPGGYTRVLRIEPQNKHFDQAASAILELVDGPKDMRFHMTAKTLVRERASGSGSESGDGDRGGAIRETTAQNVRKVTRFRAGGMEQLEAQVRKLESFLQERGEEGRKRAEWKVDEGAREGWRERNWGYSGRPRV